MRAAWLVAITAAVCAGTAAYAERGVYFPGLRISDNPSAAEQRAFVETIFRGWNVSYQAEGGEAARCTPLLDALRAGAGVTYLEPVAFGPTEKPQAVLDIEKQCPHLYLGLAWENHGSDTTARSLDFVEPVTEKQKTDAYGEPLQVTRNFKLYRFGVPNSKELRPLFVGDRSCLRGNCSMGTGYRLIDEKQCLFEEWTIFPNRDKDGNDVGPALLWTVVQINGALYFMQAGNTSSLRKEWQYTQGGPGIVLRSIPPDVKPDRGPLSACFFESPAAPRR